MADTAQFTDRIDAMVGAIEAHLSRWTTLLHLLQIGVMALAVVLSFVLTLLLGFEDIPVEDAAADARKRQATPNAGVKAAQIS